MRIPPYFVATFAALLPELALAQETSGTIAGVVRDPSQAMLAQARIAVTNEQTGLKREVETNALGEYRVPFLPVGSYSVLDWSGHRRVLHRARDQGCAVALTRPQPHATQRVN